MFYRIDQKNSLVNICNGVSFLLSYRLIFSHLLKKDSIILQNSSRRLLLNLIKQIFGILYLASILWHKYGQDIHRHASLILTLDKLLFLGQLFKVILFLMSFYFLSNICSELTWKNYYWVVDQPILYLGILEAASRDVLQKICSKNFCRSQEKNSTHAQMQQNEQFERIFISPVMWGYIHYIWGANTPS